MTKTQVSIVRVREQNTYSALQRAVEWIGGLAGAIPTGSKVVVKPNMVMGPTERGITNSVALEAVLRLAHSTSPACLTIAEGSADCYTPSVFRLHDVYDLASRYDARAVDLNQDQGVRVKVPPEVGREAVMLPRIIAECDVLISVPTYKLWMGSLPMSLSLKNLFGCYGARYYGHNKNSHELAECAPHRTLEGEIGAERGIHHPSVEQSIAAINLARAPDLCVVDALEGSDGKGNYVRLDTLIVGRNAVATDAVALAMARFVPQEQEQIRLCSEMGLGPGSLDQIEVRGLSLEEARFDLRRLQGNVLELPVGFCLERLSLSELQIIQRGLALAGLVGQETLFETRQAATEALLAVLTGEGYVARALATLPETGRDVLQRIIQHGGTSGSYYDLLDNYVALHRESNSWWAGLRSLMRLGLAYILSGQHKPYIVLAEGVARSTASELDLDLVGMEYACTVE
jgi:uncharacterized protein (DUF362 family)